MADLKPKLKLTWELTLKLNEDEAKALEAIFCYGLDVFLKVFYQHMGKHYMEPCESGLRSLETAVHQQLSPQLYDLEQTRQAMLKGLKQMAMDREASEEQRRRKAAETKLGS